MNNRTLPRLNLVSKVFLVCAAIAAVVLFIVVGPMSAPRVSAQAATPEAIAFEVASVRPSNPEQGYINASLPSLNIGGDRLLKFVQITLRDLIVLAYGIGASQIQGPMFLNGTPDSPADRFDVLARVPAGATRAQVPLMLRALLSERFHLAFHWDSKALQIYALEVAKGGPKMRESSQAPGDGAAGNGQCTRSLAEREGAGLTAVCTRMTSADIAQQVQILAPGYFRDGPVVDLSGLNGVYDFTLEWITAVQARNGEPGLTMMDAVEAQLGLKLERRRQSLDIMIVDRLDQMPEEN